MISRQSQPDIKRPVTIGTGAGLLLLTLAASAQTLVPYEVDQGEIRAPLSAAGDAARGRTIVLSRESGNCFLCHTFPNAESAPPGNLGPPLAGVGARLSAGQLRLRVVDSGRINAQSIMPAYYRIEGLTQVAANFRGKPLLSAQQVEDVVAYLAQLK